MKFIKEKTNWFTYALESEYDPKIVVFCQMLKSAMGWQEFSWDNTHKKWRFNDLKIINLFEEKFKEIKLSEDIKKDLIDEKIVFDFKSKEKASIEIKGVKGELYEYQKIGIEFLLNSGGRALLADSPGVGKTLQALGFLTHSSFKRSLIICPASVKFSWEDETNRWTYLSPFVVRSDTDIRDIPHEANVIIINFDILKKFYTEFMKYKWDCLVVDEAHLVKNPKAMRSKIIKTMSKEIDNVIMLTGTPVLSRPAEMFNMLNIIDSTKWNNYYSYAVKYCDGHQGYWGFEAKGATNLDELRNKISKYFLRRTKDDVLKELPKKNYQNIRIDLPDEYRKRYDMIEEDLITYLKRYKKDKTDKQIEKSLQAEKLVKLNLLREINAMGKLEAVKEKIDSLIESDEKVIVLSSFNGPLLELSDMYEESSVLLLGSTPVEERGEIVKQFQTNPNKKIFLGGIKSAGVGITLTAASNVIFLDLPWNPADIEQGENRAHRPGALYDSLNIYKFLSNNTIDSFMVSLLNHKQKIIDKLIEDDGEVCQEKMVNDYIKTLEEKYKKVYEKEKRNNV